MNHTLHLMHNLIMLAGVFMQIGHQYYKDATSHPSHNPSSFVVCTRRWFSFIRRRVASVIERDRRKTSRVRGETGESEFSKAAFTFFGESPPVS